MFSPALESLLLGLRSRLRRRCEVQASTRPGLTADDLEQDAIVLFVERAPRWFAQRTEVSVEAQAWTLLQCCLRNLVTAYDREQDRIVPERGMGSDDSRPDAPVEEQSPPAEARLIAAEDEAELARRVASVDNPTYRLVLKAVYIPRLLDEGDFVAAANHRSGGAQTFQRPWAEAFRFLAEEREIPYATSGGAAEREAWRRFVARCIRFDGDPHDFPDPLEATTQNWLDRTLSRARTALGLMPMEDE